MASRLVWLKARLLLNGLRHDRQRRIGFPVLLILLGAFGWWAVRAFSQTASRLDQATAGELSLWIVAIGWAIWIVMPVLFLPVDESLDR